MKLRENSKYWGCTAYSFCFLLIFLLVSNVSAQVRKEVKSGFEISRSGVFGNQVFIRSTKTLDLGSKQGDVVERALKVLQIFAADLHLSNPASELSLRKIEEDDLGISHLKFDRKINGVRIFGAELTLHANFDNSNGSVKISAGLPQSINIITTPTILESAARDFALAHIAAKFSANDLKISNSELVILDSRLIQQGNSAPRLAWKFDITNLFGGVSRTVFVSASKTAEVILELNRKFDINRFIYDCSPGDDCYLNAYSSYYKHTFGRSEGKAPTGTNPIVGAKDVDLIYDLFNGIQGFYKSNFNLNGPNGKGGFGDGKNFPSADTTGLVYLDYYAPKECPNAFFASEGFMGFCKGFASVTDVVGHEYSHAVTEFKSGLIYLNESGALNESFSDIFGEMIENHLEGQNDWQIGSKLKIPGVPAPLRSMSNPSSISSSFGPYPDRFYSNNFYCGNGDNGGVHVNSSVPNYAFYLASEGGQFNGCKISGIGSSKAQKIFYRAFTTYLSSTSNFNSTYDGIVAACDDLYGTDDSCKEVIKAMRAVEMDQAGKCSGKPAKAPNCESDLTETPKPTPADTSNPPPSSGQDVEDPIEVKVMHWYGQIKAKKKKKTVWLLTGLLYDANEPLASHTSHLACKINGHWEGWDFKTDPQGYLSILLPMFKGEKGKCYLSSEGVSSWPVSVKFKNPKKKKSKKKKK